MIVKEVDWRVATLFVQGLHYSAVMPRLTKHWLGTYINDKLVGVLTLGWGTNPMGTIQKMFPDLTTADYYDDETKELVANREKLIINKYNYKFPI
mgnify:CR=1 FL=1